LKTCLGHRDILSEIPRGLSSSTFMHSSSEVLRSTVHSSVTPWRKRRSRWWCRPSFTHCSSDRCLIARVRRHSVTESLGIYVVIIRFSGLFLIYICTCQPHDEASGYLSVIRILTDMTTPASLENIQSFLQAGGGSCFGTASINFWFDTTKFYCIKPEAEDDPFMHCRMFNSCTWSFIRHFFWTEVYAGIRGSVISLVPANAKLERWPVSRNGCLTTMNGYEPSECSGCISCTTDVALHESLYITICGILMSL
jgi:hypothetical protein